MILAAVLFFPRALDGGGGAAMVPFICSGANPSCASSSFLRLWKLAWWPQPSHANEDAAWSGFNMNRRHGQHEDSTEGLWTHLLTAEDVYVLAAGGAECIFGNRKRWRELRTREEPGNSSSAKCLWRRRRSRAGGCSS